MGNGYREAQQIRLEKIGLSSSIIPQQNSSELENFGLQADRNPEGRCTNVQPIPRIQGILGHVVFFSVVVLS